jgi:hypothetical protein
MSAHWTGGPARAAGNRTSRCRRRATAAWAVDALISWLLWLLRGREDRLAAWLQANDPGEAW